MAAEGPEAPGSPGRGEAEGALGDGGDGGDGGTEAPAASGVSGEPEAPAPEAPPPAPPPAEEEPNAATTAPPQPSPQSCNGAATAPPTPQPPPPEPEEPPPAAPEEPPPPREPEELPPPREPEEPPVAEEPPPSFPPEFERLWQAAQGNPHDFGAWTELLQYVEQENQLPAARRAFDAFFARYPYCYGYWKKYADMERRFGCARQAEEVFERGLQSIPLSMDLWIHYISFLQSTLDTTVPEALHKIRGVFEAAVAAAGLDFRSDKLWELYVEWEREQGELRRVTAIYDRVLSIPTQLYSHHWERFKEHVLHNPPKAILSPEELLWVQSKLATEPLPKAPPAEGSEAPPGEEPPPGLDGKGAAEAQEELDQEKIRELVISMRQQIYAQNEAEVSKRWNFEDGIKRPYFHVKPLERAQLRNWRDYLDFELAGGNPERTIVLFERCVIACALYEEFWVKYTRYLERQTVPGARSVFQRACGYHLPRKPTIHLLWAAFEEKQGNVEEARRILRCFEETVPGLAMVRLRRVSLERRQGNLAEAEALLLEAMRASEGLPLASFYAVKLARQASKVQKNLAKARKVLVEALEKEPANPRLHANLLELELGADVRQNEGPTLRCLERALRSPLPDEAKLLFSQRRLEFLEDFGSNIHSLLTAYDEHQKMLKLHAGRKRPPENGSEEPDDKRLRPDDPPSLLGPLGFSSGGDAASNPNYNYWYQHGYSAYSYQSPWNQYNQYYPQS